MDLIYKDEALKALEEISYALWEIDIPSPTVPEYIEHHEGVQAVMEVADRWARKIQALPSARPKGKWIEEHLITRDLVYCSKCGFGKSLEDHRPYNYCPNCGADMREVE